MYKTLTAALLAATFALAGVATAQEPAGGTTAKADPGRAESAAKRLTAEQLGQMLEDMGYEPKPVTNKEGKVIGYNVKYRSGTWDIFVFVGLSADGTNLWLTSNIGNVKDKTVPVEAILGLLEANHKLFPAHVRYFPASGNLNVGMAVRNDGITKAALKNGLEEFTDAVKETYTAFDKAVEAAKAKAEAKKEDGGK
jgi:hypothetical protein